MLQLQWRSALLQLLIEECPKLVRATALKEPMVHPTLANIDEKLRIARGRLIDLALNCTDPDPLKRPRSAREFI